MLSLSSCIRQLQAPFAAYDAPTYACELGLYDSIGMRLKHNYVVLPLTTDLSPGALETRLCVA